MGPRWRRAHGAGRPLLGVAVVLALAVPVVLNLSTWLGAALDPSVGEIARFAPASVADGIGRVVEPAERTDAPVGLRCQLDSAAMAGGGGSLLVAALDAESDRYTVQWAGGRTSYGAEDCGRSAELVLSRRSLVALISAAGAQRADAPVNAIGPARLGAASAGRDGA